MKEFIKYIISFIGTIAVFFVAWLIADKPELDPGEHMLSIVAFVAVLNSLRNELSRKEDK